MRLTALCVCATLLAVSSLCWTTADSGAGTLLWDDGFGPCAATLRPSGPCGHGQDEDTCPYRFNLPPLTVYLPKQLRELEKLVKEVQKLKDNVDQLRKMCADCTVSQNERECGRQGEREHEGLRENTDKSKVERNCVKERNPERPKENDRDFETDLVNEEKIIGGEGDSDSEKIIIWEDKVRQNWEAKRERDKGVIKGKDRAENLKEGMNKDGKTQRGTEVTKGEKELWQEGVQTGGGKEKSEDTVRGKAVGKNKGTRTERVNKKDKDHKDNSEGDIEDEMDNEREKMITTDVENTEEEDIKKNDPYVWQNTNGTEKETQTEEEQDSDRTKMSEDSDEHTNKERGQLREEKKKEINTGRNEKPKQTGSIRRTEKEKTIKTGAEGEQGEMERKIKTEGVKPIQSVQSDSDGELTSSRISESADFVSTSPSPRSTPSLTPRPRTTDLDQAETFTSSLQSLFSSSSSFIDHGTTKTALGVATPISVLVHGEHRRPDGESIFRTTSRPTTTTIITSPLAGPGEMTTSADTKVTSTTSVRPGTSSQSWIRSTTTTTTFTRPTQSLHSTASAGITDLSLGSKSISSKPKAGMKPTSRQGPKPGLRRKTWIKPQQRQPAYPQHDRKPDRAALPDRRTTQGRKHTPSHQKPTDDRTIKHDSIPNPSQRLQPDKLETDRNLKKNQLPKYDQGHMIDQKHLPIQKPNSQKKSMPPNQKPTPHRNPLPYNKTSSDRDPVTDRDGGSDQNPTFDQNVNPDQMLIHRPETQTPDKKRQLEKKPESEEKTKSDHRSEPNHYSTPIQEPEPEISQTSTVTLKPEQRLATELMENFNQNSSPDKQHGSFQDSTPAQNLKPNHAYVAADQTPKPSQKITRKNLRPHTNQTSMTELRPNPDQISLTDSNLGQKPKRVQNPQFVTDPKTKSDVKSNPDQAPQTNQRLKTTRPARIPSINQKSIREQNPEPENNKKNKPRPPPRHWPKTKPRLKPGATPHLKPKPSMQPKPKTYLDSPQISRTPPDGVEISQTDVPPTSNPVKTANEHHSQQGTESSATTMKTITPAPMTSGSPFLETNPLSHLHTFPEGVTMSLNSRTTSDPRPQTAGQSSSIPTTTRPNKNTGGILRVIIPSTSPGSTKSNPATSPVTSDSSLQAEIVLNQEETALSQTTEPDKTMTSVSSPDPKIISDVSSDFRLTTPATSGPEPPAPSLFPEFSTPSARELRVKINQVAAFLHNSLSPNGRLPDRNPKSDAEEKQGGSRPDGKLPTWLSPKVTIVRRDCSDHVIRGAIKSGMYMVTPDLRSRTFPVFCDMELHGGGWTIVQRRQDGSVNFNRLWVEYKSGFGELRGGEFWLGNDKIHLLTRTRDMMLRVELEDFDGVMGYAEYEQFKVASERLHYRLTVGGYSGTAGDALLFSKSYDHNNRAFTTPDKDHDRYPSGNCGAYYSSGWWFDACMAANLNGKYYFGRYKGVRNGIFWGTWHNISTEYYPTNDRQSFRSVRMMIRPKGFAP